MFLRRPSLSSSGLSPAFQSLPVFCMILMALAGCAASATASTSTTTSTAPVNAATSTPSVQQVCQTTLNGATLQSATAGVGFSDVTFPPNSFSTSIATSHGGDGRFTIHQFDVCSSASGVAAIQSFFAGGLPSAGWAQAAAFPYNGAYQASCGDPYCWHKGSAPRFVSLEQVTDRHNGYVTYHLRLAIPPTPPTCTPDSAGIYPTRSYDGPNLPTGSDIPAPPLTKDGLGSGGTNGNLTQGGYGGECSAGTAASINSFFTAELPALGWHHSVPPALLSPCGTSGIQWWKGNALFQWNTGGSAGASGVFWGFGVCVVS